MDNFTTFKTPYSRSNLLKRLIWSMVWLIFVRPLPMSAGRKWKILLLNLFGAKIHSTAIIYSSAKIFMPWNLIMKEYSCIASNVDCYNAACIEIGAHVTVSQYTYLCTATHDIRSRSHRLYSLPIVIEDRAWIAAKTFIGPGVTIGEGAIVGATASVYKSVPPWTVVGGNPARVINKREILNK